MAQRTFTIDTASSPWVLPCGCNTTVSGTAQNFTLEFTDTGAGGKYFGDGSNTDILLANGDTIRIEGDQALTMLWHEANGAVVNPGSIWVVQDGKRTEVKVTTETITDGDGTGANNLASITFEYPGTPYQWTWTNIQMA